MVRTLQCFACTPLIGSNVPWAMVPLNPNELSREPLDAIVREATSTGIWNGFDDAIDDRCAFSLRTSKMTCMQKKRDAPS